MNPSVRRPSEGGLRSLAGCPHAQAPLLPRMPHEASPLQSRVNRSRGRKLVQVLAQFAAAGWLFAGTAHASGATAASERITEPDTERTWVTHRVVPNERLEDIAARYGVARAEIVRWNRALRENAWIYAGQSLRVHARRVPPPRQKIEYIVERGDTWHEIATKFNVREGDLHYWNRKVPRQFRAGTRLVVFTNPLDVVAAVGVVPSVALFRARPGGLSIGAPNRGRLQSGVRLPESELYTIRDPDISWGTSHAIEVVVNSIAQFRRESAYRGDLLIGAISKRSGGRFRPHSSHQSGRDIDIRLPKIPGAPKATESPLHIDWVASWHLIRAFAESGEIEYVFLDYSRQRRLYAAARSTGATKDELARLIQFPNASGTNHGLVRHAEGHTMHIHLRIKCAKDNPSCQSY